MKKRLLRYSLVGTCLVLVLVTAGMFLPSRRASAATFATWVDANTITVNGTTYKKCTASSSCANDFLPSDLTWKTNLVDCGQPSAITPNIGKMFVDHNVAASPTLTTITSITTKSLPTRGTGKVCTSSVALTFTNSVATATGTPSGCDGGNTTDSNGNCTDTSEGTLDCQGGSFDWLICPAIWGMSKAAQQLDAFVMNTLDIDVKSIFDGTGTKGSASYGYYTAWNSFRVIATALLVIAGLVMVVSQALGFEFLDAYTIRKTLPRLFIAIIGISLSWPLMRLAVSFFDTAGFDIRSLIYGPFKDFTGKISATGGVLSTLGVGAGILLMGPASLTIILSVLIAVFAGWLALMVRELVIIVLIIVAPVAIVCYILPNTQKVWHLWRENFVGLLAAFPVISAVAAAGHVLAAVALTGGTAALTTHAFGLVHHLTGHSFNQTVIAAANNVASLPAQGAAIVFEYGWMLLIGKIITTVSGQLSTLAGGAGGFLNRASKGLQGARSNAMAKNLHAMKTGQRFEGKFLPGKTKAVARGLNSLTRGASTGVTGHFGLGQRGSEAQHAAIETAALEHMKSNEFAVLSQRDGTLQAATYNSAAQAKANNVSDADIAAFQAAGFKFGDRSIQYAAARQLASTGTGYGDLEDMTQTLARVAHGNTSSGAALAGFTNAEVKKTGRFDLAPGFSDGPNGEPGLNTLVQNEIASRGSVAGSTYAATTVRASRGADPVSILRGKPKQVKNLTEALQSHLDTQWNTYLASNRTDNNAKVEALQTAAQIKQLSDNRSYASVENQAYVNQADANTLSYRRGPNTIEDLVRPAKIDPQTGVVITPAGPDRDTWERMSPQPRNMNDPNLP